MEWYYVVGIIVAFVGLVIGFYYLGKKGLLGKDQMNILTNLIDCVSQALGAVADMTDNTVIDVIDLVMKLVNKATLAAENAWYNGEIEKEARHEYCIKELRALLDAYEVELTESQWAVVDTFIKAACEEMGHTVSIKDVDLEDLDLEDLDLVVDDQ